ncbi:MAG: tyrosine-type recombinase/integrase, partial [Terriglobales bacterium]
VLLAARSSYTALEIEQLFEAGSPFLRGNPYALAAPINTMRARRSDWRVFIRFCAERHFTPWPAAPVVVREFLEASFSAPAPRSVATVERYLSTIAHAHTLGDLPDPTKTPHVKGAYRHLARGRPSSQPRAALRGSHIAYALEHLETENLAWDLRTKALLATAYCTMARRGELVALRMPDVSFSAEARDGVVLIHNTKAGREDSRYLSREAVTWLKAWLEHAQIREGAVFRRFTPAGTVGQNAIAPQEVARIIQRVARALNVQGADGVPVWPAAHISAHSTRIGAAHDLAASGIDLTSIMHSGGWNDPKMPRYYTRELAAQESGMARMLKAAKESAKS